MPSTRRTDTVGGSALSAKKKLSSETQDRTSSTAEQKRPRAALDDSSDDDNEDRPTDYELLLSIIKPPRKKSRLERIDEKEHVVGSCTAKHQTEKEKGKRTEEEKTEGKGLDDSDSEHSDFEEIEDAKKGSSCTAWCGLFS